MPYFNVALGLIMLLFGRRLFWLFVGIAGFLLGMQLAAVYLVDSSPWLQILVGLGLGAIGALVALLAQRVAFALAGFYAGAYLAVVLVAALGFTSDQLVPTVIGGVFGAIIAAIVMDWAIIFLSSLVGAGAIMEALPIAPGLAAVLTIALVVLGCMMQSRLLGDRLRRAS
jgi:hypothetical protein